MLKHSIINQIKPFTMRVLRICRNRIGQVVFELPELQKTRLFVQKCIRRIFVQHVHVAL